MNGKLIYITVFNLYYEYYIKYHKNMDTQIYKNTY
ncbi:hypothetical protein PFMC_02223 [Plasmodium falciparum CAMP/Malaysia]|uniref:Uncharacterized protein n=1 Tax=Plasmodium falciparum (isolate Camp / Malaysia) TaxID=5835 RepID=A0A024X996_PLAFC|nr:hypothetical protein PFMC_02223 [Plasmodium falciparum CAMP/Malaysia]